MVLSFRLVVMVIGIAVTIVPLTVVILIVVTAATVVAAVVAVDIAIVANGAGAENGETTVGVSASALHDYVAVSVDGAALVDRVVVATLTDLTPDAVISTSVRAAVVLAVVVGAGAAENDVSHRAVCPVLAIVAITVGLHGAGIDDSEIAIGIAASALHDDVAV